ncbi:unnamed protein product, partial [Peniophora sp. CBMAI 1063]
MVHQAGLFAATVAAFLVDSYKSLSVDPQIQAFTMALNHTNALLGQLVRSSNLEPLVAVDPKPFHPPTMNVVYNALWFFALLLSLLAALLATLILDWMAEPITIIDLTTPETLEGYALKRLGSFMGIHRYGLDRLSTTVVGLMHLAVIAFLLGLSFFLFTFNHIIGYIIAICSGVAAFLYLVASCLPLYDQTCPYRTPVTFILRPVASAIGAVLLAIALYIIILVSSLGSWIREKGITLGDITPRHLLHALRHPTLYAPILKKLLKAWFNGDPLVKRRAIIHRAFHPDHGPTTLSVEQLLYVTTYTKLDLLDNPQTTRYMARCLFDMQTPGISTYVAQLREHRAMMSRLAAVFNHIQSPLESCSD